MIRRSLKVPHFTRKVIFALADNAKFVKNLLALGTNGAHQVHDDFTCGLRGGDSSVPRALAIFFGY